MDNTQRLKCKCGNILNEEQFALHFHQCPDFKNCFRKFDTTFGELLKSYAEPKENLPIIRFLLKQYINVLDKKIKAQLPNENNSQKPLNPPNLSQPIAQPNKPYNSFDNAPNPNLNQNNNNNNNVNINPNPNPYLNNNYGNVPNNNPYGYPMDNNNNNNNINPMNNNNNNNINPGGFKNPMMKPYEEEQQDESCCQICHDLNFTYLDCCHPICLPCFQSMAEKDFPNMKCKKCSCVIQEAYKKEVLGMRKYDELDKKFLGQILGQLVECPGCHEKNSFESGNIDYTIRDDQNKVISREACEDYAKNRCRCGSCQMIFCAQCKASPYHIGMTCLQFSNFQKSLRCKYDDVVITNQNRGPANDVCNNDECKERFALSCKKKLKCNHNCFGCQGERQCPPCLEEDCPQYGRLFDQTKDGYCNICFTEGLGSAPVVLLSCNHYIHFKCIETRLKTKWIGPKITFNHCLCPVCNKWFDCQSNPTIQALIDQYKALYKEISEMALKRLKFEDLDKDTKLTDPNSKWYGKTLDYALNRLSYYMCFLCQKPYFAGRRECGDGPNVNNDNPNKNYDPKDCVCGKHANLAGVAGVTECKTHGKEYIEYKCKFCCKIASWFCWGTTHFCEDCHARQCKGDYVSKYTKDKLPKCDPKKCELKVKHPENGEEFALGCSVCRNAEANVKDF